MLAMFVNKSAFTVFELLIIELGCVNLISDCYGLPNSVFSDSVFKL